MMKRSCRPFYQQAPVGSKNALRAALFSSALLFACQESKAPEHPPFVVVAAPSAVVTARGAIEGTVRLVGKVPAPKPLLLPESVRRVCGESIADRSLVVGEDGALAYAVVSVEDTPTSASPPPIPELDQRRCAYEPPVLAARAGSTLRVKSSDPLLHNVRAAQGSAPLFNVAMPIEHMTLNKPLPTTPGAVDIRCDLHPWMRATVVLFTHDSFAVTDASGAFRLERGERLPVQTMEVEVPAGGTAKVDGSWQAAEL